jgi:hypothetical protein
VIYWSPFIYSSNSYLLSSNLELSTGLVARDGAVNAIDNALPLRAHVL